MEQMENELNEYAALRATALLSGQEYLTAHDGLLRAVITSAVYKGIAMGVKWQREFDAKVAA